MSLKSFILGMFTGQKMNGEIEQVKESARNDARELTTAYFDAFADEARKIMHEKQQLFLGHTPTDPEVGPTIDAEYKVKQEYANLDRPALMRLAKEAGHPVQKTMTKDDLIDLLS